MISTTKFKNRGNLLFHSTFLDAAQAIMQVMIVASLYARLNSPAIEIIKIIALILLSVIVYTFFRIMKRWQISPNPHNLK